LLNTIFLGTPDVAVPFLKVLAEKSRLLGVVTMPDQPVGRGYELACPPVKNAALGLGVPVLQPAALRAPAVEEALRRWGAADLGVAVAYGKIIPLNIFSYPRLGMLNVHFSLLPKYRGAAPVQWALIRGERRTGVSLFQIEEALDSGPIYLQAGEDIRTEDNSLTLRARLVEIGVRLLEDALSLFERGECFPKKQEGEPSLAPSLRKVDGLIHWNLRSAEDVINLIRGTYEWPSAYTFFRGQMLKIREAGVARGNGGEPGEIVGLEKGQGFLVRCAKEALLVRRVQPEGKKEMGAMDFWNGARLKLGDRFESPAP